MLKDISSLKINTSMMNKAAYNIYRGDYLKICATLKRQYDLIIFDPPYNLYKTDEIHLDVRNQCILIGKSIVPKSSVIIPCTTATYSFLNSPPCISRTNDS